MMNNKRRLILIIGTISFIAGVLFYRNLYAPYFFKIKRAIQNTIEEENSNIGYDDSITVIRLEIDSFNTAKLNERLEVIAKFGRGHRAYRKDKEKFTVSLYEGGLKEPYQAWIKGGTGVHHNGEKMPSINLRTEKKRFALARFEARFGVSDFISFCIGDQFGIINNKPELYNVLINDTFQGLYWKEERIESLLKLQNKSGYLIDFDLDYMWSRNVLVNNGWHPGYESVFHNAPFKVKKIGRPDKLDTEITRDWILEHLDYREVGKIFLLIDLIGYDHCIAITNLDLFYDEEQNKVRLIPKDFQRVYPHTSFFMRKLQFNERNFLFESISHYSEFEDWPGLLGVYDKVWNSYMEQLNQINSTDFIQSMLNWKNDKKAFEKGRFDKEWRDMVGIVDYNLKAINDVVNQKPLMFSERNRETTELTNYTFIDYFIVTRTDTILLPSLKKLKSPTSIKIKTNDLDKYKLLNPLSKEMFQLDSVLNYASDIF